MYVLSCELCYFIEVDFNQFMKSFYPGANDIEAHDFEAVARPHNYYLIVPIRKKAASELT